MNQIGVPFDVWIRRTFSTDTSLVDFLLDQVFTKEPLNTRSSLFSIFKTKAVKTSDGKIWLLKHEVEKLNGE